MTRATPTRPARRGQRVRDGAAEVRRDASRGTTRGAAPAGAAQLGAVASPPVSALVEQMLLDSDNDLAEALAHLAGVASGAGGSFAGGTAAAGTTLGWLGIDDAAVEPRRRQRHLDRGRDRRRDPRRASSRPSTRADQPELAPMLSGLPVAGSPVRSRRASTDRRPRSARGDVRAKTGTLTGVTSLAGTVLDRDGRTLVFVVLADEASSDTLAVRAALDRVAATLAGCGCR